MAAAGERTSGGEEPIDAAVRLMGFDKARRLHRGDLHALLRPRWMPASLWLYLVDGPGALRHALVTLVLFFAFVIVPAVRAVTAASGAAGAAGGPGDVIGEQQVALAEGRNGGVKKGSASRSLRMLVDSFEPVEAQDPTDWCCRWMRLLRSSVDVQLGVDGFGTSNQDETYSGVERTTSWSCTWSVASRALLDLMNDEEVRKVGMAMASIVSTRPIERIVGDFVREALRSAMPRTGRVREQGPPGAPRG